MAINFPDSPGIGSVFTDTTSGFSYEWTGTLWKSYSANTVSNIQILDDISGSFDDIETTFNLTVSTVAATPVNAQQIEIILGGIQQSPGVDYTISGSTVIFTTAPTNGLTFSGKLLGTALTLNTIASGTDGSGLVNIPAGELTGTLPSLVVSGISTLGSNNGIGTVYVGLGSTALYVDGDARITGILTVGTDSITLNGTNNIINVGSGVTIDGNTGVISATTLYGDGSNLSGVSASTQLVIGVRAGAAVTFNITGSSFNVANRSGGDTVINI